MKAVYLASTAQDIMWFRTYYRPVFPAGKNKARDNLKSIQALLVANPYIGHVSEVHKGVLEFNVKHTPFSLIYRVTETQIEVLRLWDERQGSVY